jgi:soluble lytic murein transglycosylase-like protein
MQLMPETAARYSVTNRLDPEQNIRGGTRYLGDLLLMFNNDLRLALAAYNAGENAVVKYGNRVPPYRETVEYVPRVMAYYWRYRAAS